MTWLTTQEVADLIGVDISVIQKAAKNEKSKYVCCHVNGKGRGGEQLRISLESVYEKFPHLREEPKHENIETAKNFV